MASPADAATLGHPGVAVPLYALDGTCSDRRFPQLAGEWAIGCDKAGRLDRALRLTDGRQVTLSPPLDPNHTAVAAGTTPGTAVLVEVSTRTRIIDLSGAGPVERADATRLPKMPIAPPATTDTHFAAILPDQIEGLPHHEQVRRPYRTQAAGWYPPALAWPVVAWVESSADGDEDVWVRTFEPPGPAELLASGTGFQRHVVSDGTSLAWVAPDRLHLWNPQTGQKESLPANTGFHAPPSLSDGVLCWEERRTPPGGTRPRPDIDILCSDGLEAAGPGDQLFPSRSGSWLLYRSDGHTWLLTAP